MKFRLNIFLVALLTCFATSCSWFSFSSNIDPKNFKEYYKSSLVKPYSKEEFFKLESYTDLGLVEGISCKMTDEEPEPNENLAFRVLLEKAYEIGADGVVVGKCVHLENTLDCLSEYTCYGQAIKTTNVQ